MRKRHVRSAVASSHSVAAGASTGEETASGSPLELTVVTLLLLLLLVMLLLTSADVVVVDLDATAVVAAAAATPPVTISSSSSGGGGATSAADCRAWGAIVALSSNPASRKRAARAAALPPHARAWRLVATRKKRPGNAEDATLDRASTGGVQTSTPRAGDTTR